MRRTFVVIVLALAAGASAAFAMARLPVDSPPPGTKATLDVAGSEPIPAVPRPAVLPEPVAATGACAGAMDVLRALIVSIPSGALLDDAQNTQLTAGLDGLDGACSDDESEEFRDRELVPWLTYAPR